MSKPLYTNTKKKPDFDSIVNKLDLDPEIKEKLKKNEDYEEKSKYGAESLQKEK
jgi:hypothetical protein